MNKRLSERGGGGRRLLFLAQARGSPQLRRPPARSQPLGRTAPAGAAHAGSRATGGGAADPQCCLGELHSAFHGAYLGKSVPHRHREGRGTPLIHATSGAPRRAVGEGRVLRPCSAHWSGEDARLHAAEGHRHTARAPGGKRRRLLAGTRTCNPSSGARGRGEKGDFYLFSPSSPGISKPWPPALRALSSRRRGAGQGRGSWTGSGVARLGRPHGIPGALLPGALATATLGPLVSAAPPGPGRWPTGSLPEPGRTSGTGQACSSVTAAVPGCLCLLRCKGGRQAQFSAKDDKTQRPLTKGRGRKEAVLCRLSCGGESVHGVRRGSGPRLVRAKGSNCPPRESGS